MIRFDAKGKGLGMSGRRDVRDLPTLWPRLLHALKRMYVDVCIKVTKIANLSSKGLTLKQKLNLQKLSLDFGAQGSCSLR